MGNLRRTVLDAKARRRKDAREDRFLLILGQAVDQGRHAFAAAPFAARPQGDLAVGSQKRIRDDAMEMQNNLGAPRTLAAAANRW